MTVTLNDLYEDPDHYLHSFDGEYAVFVPMDRDAYARSIFLDRRIQPADSGAIRAPIEPLLRGWPPVRTARWIFHVAHCGSTLLANAMERLGDHIVLREPAALRQVAVSRAHHHAVLAPRRRDQRPRQLDGAERVVAHGREVLRQPGEHALAVVADGRDVPVRGLEARHPAAVGRHQPLHPEADAEHRAGRVEQHRRPDREVARHGRVAGPRGQHDVGVAQHVRR